jgi:hypothetical protein
MVSKSAKQAVCDVLELNIEERQSQELYYNICNYLMEKDDFCYVDILRFKYSLHIEDFSNELIDYFVMEYILKKMKEQHSLVLSAITYVATSKS